MSFLFHKKTKTAIKWVWSVIAILIALSMVLAYSGGIGSSRSASAQPATAQPTSD